MAMSSSCHKICHADLVHAGCGCRGWGWGGGVTTGISSLKISPLKSPGKNYPPPWKKLFQKKVRIMVSVWVILCFRSMPFIDGFTPQTTASRRDNFE